MKRNFEELDQIKKLIAGELSEEEEKQLNERIANDSDFSDSADLFQKLHLEFSRREAIKTLERIKISRNKQMGKHKYFKWLVIVLLLLSFGVAFYLIYVRKNIGVTPSETIEHIALLADRYPNTLGDDKNIGFYIRNNDLEKAFDSIMSQCKNSVCDDITNDYLLGILFLYYKKNYKEAYKRLLIAYNQGGPAFFPNVDKYLARALLASGKKAEALELLDSIDTLKGFPVLEHLRK